MEVKMLEVRDRATMISVMAVGLQTMNANEVFLLERAGYGIQERDRFVIVTNMVTGESTYDPYKQDKTARTMFEAHKFISKNFSRLKTGDVVDVEFILGETSEPKVSENPYK